jgi:hypothetical protein
MLQKSGLWRVPLAVLAFGAAAMLAGALGPSVRDAIAQGFPGTFLDGTPSGPSVRGTTDAGSGLYFGSGFTGISRHVAAGSVATNNLPVISVCGTSPALASGSTDFAGKITVGTSASAACTLTFGTAYTTAPFCIVQNLSTMGAANVYAVTTTAITFSSVLADSTVLHYHCVAPSGG